MRRKLLGRWLRIAVPGLGLVSALALAFVASMDMGDPRAEARAAAREAAEARQRAMVLRWDELRREEGELPGAVGRYVDDGDRPWIRDDGEARPEPEEPVAGVFDALLEQGQRALADGRDDQALALLIAALEQPDGPRRGEALLAAARASGAEPDRFREELYARPPEPGRRGTSRQLLAALVEPVDAAAAERLLRHPGEHLPPPRDRVAGIDGALAVHLDPWWEAVRRRLAAEGDDVDWRLMLHESQRTAAALTERLLADGAEPGTDWQLASVDEVLVAFRRDGERTVMTHVDRHGLVKGLWRRRRGSARLQARLGAAGSMGAGATVLPGSPLALSVRHPRPEAAAAPQLARIRALRIGLAGLAALIGLASILAARAMARARRLAELRSTFVASVSHDLRTPTQGILLMAEALEQGLVKAPAAVSAYHGDIRREAQRLRRMVEDLLDGARVDRGDMARVERQEVATGAFFDRLEAAMGERARDAGAELRVVRGALPEALLLDPEGVHRALWNLVENALLHGRTGDEPARITATIDMEGEMLRCEVADQGPGVPARMAETVFEPFERLADRGKGAGIAGDTGTGLGLAIVRALARAHGGDAALHRDGDGPGARFVATFHAAETGRDVA